MTYLPPSKPNSRRDTRYFFTESSQAIEAIDEGIKLAYRYTDIHKTAFQLFYLYLAGELVGDTPQELLETAIQGAACNRKSDDLRKDEGDDEARRDE